MIINQIKLKPGESKDHLPLKIQKKTGKKVRNWRILRESIDARNKGDIRLVYSVEYNYDPSEKPEFVIPEAVSDRSPDAASAVIAAAAASATARRRSCCLCLVMGRQPKITWMVSL